MQLLFYHMSKIFVARLNDSVARQLAYVARQFYLPHWTVTPMFTLEG